MNRISNALEVEGHNVRACVCVCVYERDGIVNVKILFNNTLINSISQSRSLTNIVIGILQYVIINRSYYNYIGKRYQR